MAKSKNASGSWQPPMSQGWLSVIGIQACIASSALRYPFPIEMESMPSATKPHDLSPKTVPTRVSSNQTCQTHWEGWVSVIPALSGGFIMASSIRWSSCKDTGHRGSGAASARADANWFWGRDQSKTTPEPDTWSRRFPSFSAADEGNGVAAQSCPDRGQKDLIRAAGRVPQSAPHSCRSRCDAPLPCAGRCWP